jgi:hypothetical protein
MRTCFAAVPESAVDTKGMSVASVDVRLEEAMKGVVFLGDRKLELREFPIRPRVRGT